MTQEHQAPEVTDAVNHPEHYLRHPSGVECIAISEHMTFCLGNVIKYVWRADLKNGVEDLKKARWYIDREIQRRDASKIPDCNVSKLSDATGRQVMTL